MPLPAPVTMARLSRKRPFAVGDVSTCMRSVLPKTPFPRVTSDPIGWLVQSSRRQREDLGAGFGHPDRMFELCGKRAIAGDGRPTVREHFDMRSTQIDHRLDGEKHARFELDALADAANMDDVGFVVEQPPQSVAAEIAHHAHVLGLDIALNEI